MSEEEEAAPTGQSMLGENEPNYDDGFSRVDFYANEQEMNMGVL